MRRWVVALFVVAVALANDAVAQLNCTNSGEDEAIIEYFNEVSFNDLFEIILMQNPDTSYGVQLSCPERESNEIVLRYLWIGFGAQIGTETRSDRISGAGCLGTSWRARMLAG